jgi:hypothetical protein
VMSFMIGLARAAGTGVLRNSGKTSVRTRGGLSVFIPPYGNKGACPLVNPPITELRGMPLEYSEELLHMRLSAI